MSEHTPEGPDLDPASEDSVRRLLAEARHTGPVPPEVAARLDDLLGKLVEARSAETGVSSLAARRSRRRGLLLVAAVAALVIGIGVPAINRVGQGGSDTASDAGSATSAQDRSDPSAGDQQLPAEAAPAAPTAPPPLALSSDGLGAEVRAALLARDPSSRAYSSELLLLPAGCGLPSSAEYVYLAAATYDGQDAVLGAAAVQDGRQRVDLYLCGTPDPVRSITVEAPR